MRRSHGVERGDRFAKAAPGLSAVMAIEINGCHRILHRPFEDIGRRRSAYALTR